MKTHTDETSQRPNYRIYDRTGGGVTHDIYAESLEDAIEQGRAWIEDGDWSSEDGETHKTIALECEVGPIIYLRKVQPKVETHQRGKYIVWGPYRSYLAGDHDGVTQVTIDLVEETLAKAGKVLQSEVEDIVDSAVDASENDEVEAVYVRWENDCADWDGTDYDETDDEDEEATADADKHDCSGEYSDEIPLCEQRLCEAATSAGDEYAPEDEDQGHWWQQPRSVIGEFGARSNGGTAMTHYYVCRLCGEYKTECTPGVQRNPNEPLETIAIIDRDEKSEAWLKETHEDEDGFIPAWLAEMLDCSPSTKMTAAQAAEYVAEHTDEDDLDEDDLEHAFAATFGRRADDKDRAEGLWSHLCAATV